MTDAQIEREIQDKGLTAPRVTAEYVESRIRAQFFFTGREGVALTGFNGAQLKYLPALDLLTFCVLVLANGFTVTGESACASPENFDADIGRKIARANAVAKIRPLEGYLLKTHMADAGKNAPG